MGNKVADGDTTPAAAAIFLCVLQIGYTYVPTDRLHICAKLALDRSNVSVEAIPATVWPYPDSPP